jgi:hypothetical protein
VARIGLVSCASRKVDSEQVARDLYCSTLFNLSRAYAEHACDRWFILSAKYGLLDPATRVAPYDLTLNNMPIGERREWATRVGAALAKVMGSADTIVMLAGNRYAEHLPPLIHAHGVDVERPLQGMRIGEQQRWLKGRSNAALE